MISSKTDNKTKNNKINSTAPNPILHFIKMLLSPINGWKQIKSAGFKSEEVGSKLFYPSIALVSAAEFIHLIYYPNATLTSILQSAIATFIAFFLGYFAILFLTDFVFAKVARAKIKTEFGKVYIMMNLTTLTLFYLIYEIFPLAAPIIVFTPIYTLYVIIKGAKCLRIPEEHFSVTIMMFALLIIGLPILIHYIFTAITPEV